MRPILKGGLKRAGEAKLAETVKEKLLRISELEAAKSPSVDGPAHLFGELLGEIFACGTEGASYRVLYECGLHLGIFIYAADAAEDYSDDYKTGKYNPYVLAYGKESLSEENKAAIKCALILECKKIEAAVNLLPFGTRTTIENIVKNIIYLGLIKRISFLDPVPEEKM